MFMDLNPSYLSWNLLWELDDLRSVGFDHSEKG